MIHTSRALEVRRLFSERMQGVVGPALRGARSLDRARFLPQKALARFPWNSLLDAAEDAQRRFGNINTLEYEAGRPPRADE